MAIPKLSSLELMKKLREVLFKDKGKSGSGVD
jgi:hypothetical protein